MQDKLLKATSSGDLLSCVCVRLSKTFPDSVIVFTPLNIWPISTQNSFTQP